MMKTFEMICIEGEEFDIDSFRDHAYFVKRCQQNEGARTNDVDVVGSERAIKALQWHLTKWLNKHFGVFLPHPADPKPLPILANFVDHGECTLPHEDVRLHLLENTLFDRDSNLIAIVDWLTL